MTSDILRSLFFCFHIATLSIALVNSLTVPLRKDLLKLIGFGDLDCILPINYSVYKIAILVPFDPRLDDISMAPPPQNQSVVATYLAPALELALEHLKDLHFLTFRDSVTSEVRIFPRFKFFWADTKCEIQPTLDGVFRFLLDEPVHGFIGPVCTFPLASATRIVGSRFKRPLVTFGGSEIDFSNKADYPLLTRLGGHHGCLKGFLYTVFTYFGWEPRAYKNIALLHARVNEEADNSKVTAQVKAAASSSFYVAKAILSEGMRFRIEGIIADRDNVEDMRARLIQLSQYGRIVILCADPETVRKLMLLAYDLGFINGEYVFFNIDLLSSSEQQIRPWYRADASDAENRNAREAYRVLMTVTLRKPNSPEYLRFTKEVQRRAKHDYNYTYMSNEINPFIGAFHDAVLLYAYALNDTLSSSGSIWDGDLLTEKMRNRTFRGIAGHVSVDSNGDRNADYSLLDMDPETGDFEVVANYYGNEKVYVPVKTKSIDWANNANLPPPDTPPCGFDGTLCRQNNIMRFGIVAAVFLVTLFFVILIGGIYIYRKTRFQAKLKAMNWVIRWECLQVSNGRHSRHRRPSGTRPLDLCDDLEVSSYKKKNSQNVMFSLEDPSPLPRKFSEPEHEFLLDGFSSATANLDNRPRGANCNVSLEPSPTVTFEADPFCQDSAISPAPAQREKKNSFIRGVLKLTSTSLLIDRSGARKEKSPPNTSISGPVNEAFNNNNNNNNNSSNDNVPTTPSVSWTKQRQQRWSRRSEALSHDTIDTTSATSAGGGMFGAFWSKRNSSELQGHNKHRRRSGSNRKESSFRKRGRKKSYGFEESRRRNSISNESVGSFSSLDTISGVHLDYMSSAQMFINTTIYKGNVVALKALNPERRIDVTEDLLIEVSRVKDLNSEHICRFVGACIEVPNQCLVYEYCPKGSLQDVLENEQIKLDWMFKFSLMQDICRGMIYLHHNLGAHGNLKSSNCLVNSRFVLKITDFGLHLLRGPIERPPKQDTYAYHRNQLWTAPELLKNREYPPMRYGTLKGDIYSFAIVCQEIVYRKGVFYIRNQNYEPKAILEKVGSFEAEHPFRPTLETNEGCTAELVELITQAWDEHPDTRPEFTTIKVSMRKMNKSGDTGNLLDNVVTRMEYYANNLEDLVKERTAQYLEEKSKAEDLLYSMLPKSVASQLIKKESVTAESFDMVTIFFSDIVGFTSMSAESTPMQVVELLNQLYTRFDSISERFDVYKVETIGDAYVVASGLPQRNENRHAREIARMSIEFLKAMLRFRIPHRPETQLQLRIGVHSGPVCAGVVGMKMPRYCLFGDTVNTSSRMESNGLPLKIHISYETMSILRLFGVFIMSERGYVEMKGKGARLTYWLHGEYRNIVDPIPEGAKLVASDPCAVNGPTMPPPFPPEADSLIDSAADLFIASPPDSLLHPSNLVEAI